MKILLLLLVGVALVVLVTNLASQADMNSTIQNFQASVTTIAYAGEFDDIRISVDEFLELRTIRGTENGNLLANRIDERLNNLELVKTHCTKEISSLELVYENNPYEKLQQICPALKDISLSKAAELFRMI